MNKSAIKRYAVWARRELIFRVSQRALLYGISEEEQVDASAISVNGIVFSEVERKQRKALIEQIAEKGYTQVIEEVAYTWFNRFAALRFMEVNGYLPSRVRVFTDSENAFKPQILSEAIHLELHGLDMEKVYALKEADEDEALFKYLLITQCNALGSILPGMFERIADETELLLPDNLLRDGSVIEQMIVQIPEDDWKDAIQIIGWLYQYYNTEKKDEVFAALKKNVRVTKENIPAATQLFTPDWIVRYMVENSLGRLWVEGHPDAKARFIPDKEERNAYAAGERENPDGKWYYYLEEAEQEPEVQLQLDEIRKEYTAFTPEDLLCIDPCSGSGHILCYLFDVLFQIYQSFGYTTREAVASIIEKNLWGLDIDDRAAQLAYFAVMMKARKYDSHFLTREDENGIQNIPQPHVYAIVESNGIDQNVLDYFCAGRPDLTKSMLTIVKELNDGKAYGSILTTTSQDWEMLYARLNEVDQDISMHKDAVIRQIKPLVQVAQTLAQTYHIVVTNPPYMGSSGQYSLLCDYLKKHYPDSKTDLFAVFIERCCEFTKENGYHAMITQHSWMFLSSFEKLRNKLMLEDTVNMAHLGSRAFEEISGEVVQTTSFVIRKSHIVDYQGVYFRLIEPTTQDGKEKMFLSYENCYSTKQSKFSQIPGSPVAYWISDRFADIFANSKSMGEYAEARKGLVTGNDAIFLKMWHEISIDQFSVFSDFETTKWKPCNKGGSYRKWYGNNNYVVNWGNDGSELSNHRWPDGRQRSSLRNSHYFFKKAITWTYITSANNCFRYYPDGFAFAGVGPGLFPKNANDLLHILAYTNSVVFDYILKMIGSSTISLESGEVERTPIVIPGNQYLSVIETITKNNIIQSKADWDSFETSWDFLHHPLVTVNSGKPEMDSNVQWEGTDHLSLIFKQYEVWQREEQERFQKLKENEEELNRIFIDIYGLKDELMPEVEDKNVTVHRIFDNKDNIPVSMWGSNYALTKRDVIVSLISYAVGCMFGRYSLDVDGLAYAGGEWDLTKYKTFIPDKDAILPICDDLYFNDDIVNRFVEFIRVAYGDDTLEENLKFIADALGGKGTPRDVIRRYFLNDFYADHCKTYQKRPIYWLFDSGRNNGFKCLIYMHRYKPDTIARIRTDYVHEQQSRYRTAIEGLEKDINGASATERVRINKELKKLRAQAAEIQGYEEKIHHLADQFISIDLDDGVKVNYAKFQDVLAKIK